MTIGRHIIIFYEFIVWGCRVLQYKILHGSRIERSGIVGEAEIGLEL